MIRRGIYGAILFVVVAVGLVVSRNAEPSTGTSFSAEFRPGTPSLDDRPDVVTATWFCGGTSALGQSAEGEYGGELIISNPTDSPVSGLVTILTGDQAPMAEVVTVEPRAKLVYDVDAKVTAPFASTLVELDDSRASVEQRAIHPAGAAVAPCANQTSSEWFFPDGFTASSSDFRILISNPYLSPAIVDLDVSTQNGPRSPSNLQGFVVPARSLRVVNISTSGFRDEKIAAISVRATAGRIVAAKYQHYLGTGRLGHIMALGAPSTADQWWFADGEKGSGVAENYMILNPTSAEVVADLVVLGLDPTAPPVPSSSVTIPPGEVVVFDMANVAGLPDGRHGVLVASRSGPSIVVERVLTRPVESTVATTAMIGIQGGYQSKRWVIPVSSNLALEGALVILNTSGFAGTVTVSSVGPGGSEPVPRLTNLAIPANGILVIDLVDEILRGRSLEVESDQLILVERRLERTATLRGRSGSWAIPE
ncbi:MAG: DUF5719 family protein [Actinomycetota bacterium]